MSGFGPTGRGGSRRPLLPAGLVARLRSHSAIPVQDDPLLLAKVITDDGELYLINLHDDPHGEVLTCFDPSFEPGYPTVFLSILEGGARLCPDFRPMRLSVFAPEWLSQPGEPDDWL